MVSVFSWQPCLPSLCRAFGRAVSKTVTYASFTKWLSKKKFAMQCLEVGTHLKVVTIFLAITVLNLVLFEDSCNCISAPTSPAGRKKVK